MRAWVVFAEKRDIGACAEEISGDAVPVCEVHVCIFASTRLKTNTNIYIKSLVSSRSVGRKYLTVIAAIQLIQHKTPPAPRHRRS